jgi:YD repeat-containing protein
LWLAFGYVGGFDCWFWAAWFELGAIDLSSGDDDRGHLGRSRPDGGLKAWQGKRFSAAAANYGLSFGAMTGCVLIGALLAPVVSGSQTVGASRCFSYDDAGRLSSVRDEGGQVRTYGLDAASNRKGVTSGSGSLCAVTNVPAPSTSSAAPAAGSAPATPPASSTNNRAPVAVADVATVEKLASTKSVLVLVNDTDADGDPLEVTAAAYDSSKVQVTRVRSLTSASRYVYLDIVGVAVGTSQVQYTISDGRGGQAIGTVSVTITPASLQ